MNADLLFLRSLTDWQHPLEEVDGGEDSLAADGCSFNPTAEFQLQPADKCQLISPPLLLDHQAEAELPNSRRPFSSLMLPVWVHEKSEADEAAGIACCRSLAPFSACSSPASSCTSSPEVPVLSELSSNSQSHSAQRTRRSTVCWADLVENDDEESSDSQDPWGALSNASSMSTAASSPEGCLVDKWRKFEEFSIVKDQEVSLTVPTAPDHSQDFLFQTTVALLSAGKAVVRDSGVVDKVRWVDLVESDLDPLDYAWSSLASPPRGGSDELTLKSREVEAEEKASAPEPQEEPQEQQIAVGGTTSDRKTPQETPSPAFPEARRRPARRRQGRTGHAGQAGKKATGRSLEEFACRQSHGEVTMGNGEAPPLSRNETLHFASMGVRARRSARSRGCRRGAKISGVSAWTGDGRLGCYPAITKEIWRPDRFGTLVACN